MSRKSTQLTFVGGKGPRQRVWDLIRAKQGKRFELLEVCPGDVPSATARTYVQSLAAAAILAPDSPRTDAFTPHCPVKGWTLAKDCGIEAPRVRKDGTPVTQGRAQENMWRTLRTIKHPVSARELAAYASTTDLPVAEVAAQDYLNNLRLAGYVGITSDTMTQVLAKYSGGKRSPKKPLYSLNPGSNTGPRAPMVCRTDVIYDPNTDITMPIRRVSDEDFIYGK